MYPTDIAVIITTYLLPEKKPVFRSSWSCEQYGLISAIDGKIFVCGCQSAKTYDLDGKWVEKYSSQNPERFSYQSRVADDKYVYSVSLSGCRLQIFDKDTYVSDEIDVPNQYPGTRLHGLARSGNVLYMTDHYHDHIYRYDTMSRKFLSLWHDVDHPIHIKTHGEWVFVHNNERMSQYNSKGERVKIIPIKGKINDFVICEDRIFVCRPKSIWIWVYDMDGLLGSRIHVEQAEQIAAIDNNIIVKKTNDRIFVFSMEHNLIS